MLWTHFDTGPNSPTPASTYLGGASRGS